MIMQEQKMNMQKKVLSGVVWKFAERILAQIVSLVVSITIARLLEPSDYGVVSIVTVFFTFANVIIAGGLNTALIQKKNADAEDYNTVFTISFLMAVIIYAILFFVAPWIADVYNQPILVSIIRILGMSLPIYAFKSIVCAYVSSNLNFRMFFWATLGGTIASAIVGISMAIAGFGAWALVAQQLTNTIIDTIVLYALTKLKVSFKLSKRRFKPLFKYGYKILCSSLLSNTFSQINPLFVGLKYTSADLSFYTKGKSFPDIISSSTTYTISSVLFPALSKYQEDKETLLRYTRKYMQVSSFFLFPIMIGFFAIADKFVILLLTEKWLPTVYYIRIGCLATMFDVVAVGNCETIKAMGRSDIYLKIEIIKKMSYFITIILFLIFTDSPQMLALSMVVCTVIQVLVNSIPNQKLIDYTVKQQLSDIMPNLVSSIIMGICVLLIGTINTHALGLFVIQILSGCIVYIFISIVIKNKAFNYILNMIKNITASKKKETR